MIYMPLLAEAQQAAGGTIEIENVDVVPMDFIWTQITALTWLQAVLAISFGVVYLMYGWRIFRVLVVICFALIGMFLGIKVGQFMGSQIWGGILGLILLAAISMPLMKWCVCLLGAVAGGILTAGVWYAFELPQMYIWAGATVGIVAGGMISFIVLKASVMLFTSLGGSVITVVGMLALLHLYEGLQEPVTTYVHDLVMEQNWFFPLVLTIPTIIGIIIQNKFVKHSHKWEL
ncbi:MAG: hypothetical protein JW912_07675 [Sedimentisphaerales bacterium]|nr:hypothetical protein [Sedimentisphaerales bacterium]